MTRNTVHTDRAPTSKNPLSQAVIHGGVVYCAGQGPLDPKTGEIVPGGIEAQARQTFENIRAVLAAAGTSLAEALTVTCYLRKREDIPGFNAVYREEFAEPYPARSAFIVGDLFIDIDIEVVVTAALPSTS